MPVDSPITLCDNPKTISFNFPTQNILHQNSTKFIPYVGIFLSGFTSLTYELLWIKQFKLLFGATLYAISAVLCAFMLGLALGAWLITKFLDAPNIKKFHPIRFYGILELIIGIYALILPLILKSLSPIYPHLISLSQNSDGTLHILQFFIGTLVMLPATMLMGATLPVLGRWAISDQYQIFPGLSVLYGLNTFGAVAGCVWTQFIAVSHLGISGTNFSAVIINILVFGLCFWGIQLKANPNITTSKSESSNIRNSSATQPILSFLLLVLFGYSGLVALSSEILWTRILVFPLGSSLYSFAIILSAFLFGIGLGSIISKPLLGNSKWILKFILVELAIGVFCLMIFPIFNQFTELISQIDQIFYSQQSSPEKTLWIRTLFAFGLMLIPTLGFGMAFPLANHIHFSIFNNVTKTLGNSYAVNTIGAILGTIITPFFLIPWLGIKLSLFTLYGILILLSLVCLLIHIRPRKLTLAISFVTLIILGITFDWGTLQVDTSQIGNKNFTRVEINSSLDNTLLLDYKEGSFSTLAVVEEKQTGARTLYIDGFSTATASNSVGGSAYMQAMGWIPMMLHFNPKKALVMCFGTGNTLSTVSQFPNVSVDAVEIDRNVLSVAPWFSKWNRNVLEQPHVQIHVQDARNFIQWTQDKYDVITLEPMSPVQAGVNSLYSQDFYQHSKAHLNSGGIMMQWLPLHLVGPKDTWSILKTFQSVFPHTTIWNSFLTRIVLLVGSEKPLQLDITHFNNLMKQGPIKTMAHEIGVYGFEDFMDFYLTDGKSLFQITENAKTITDDFPLLEHSPVTLVPPLKKQTDETFINFLRFRVNRHPPVKGWTLKEKNYFSGIYQTRTAQRLSIFSQRYLGPGNSKFEQKSYLEGLKEIQTFLKSQKNKYLKLNSTGWQWSEKIE